MVCFSWDRQEINDHSIPPMSSHKWTFFALSECTQVRAVLKLDAGRQTFAWIDKLWQTFRTWMQFLSKKANFDCKSNHIGVWNHALSDLIYFPVRALTYFGKTVAGYGCRSRILTGSACKKWSAFGCENTCGWSLCRQSSKQAFMTHQNHFSYRPIDVVITSQSTQWQTDLNARLWFEHSPGYCIKMQSK